MKRIVICKSLFILLILFGSYAWAVDLNAPGEKKVTVGSEIKRGCDAIFEVSGPDDLLRELGKFDRVFNLNKQKNTDTPGFLLGASFAAWQFLDMRLESKIPQANRDLAYKYASGYFRDFRKLQKQLKITDDKLVEAVGQIKPFTNEAYKWEAKTKQK